MGVGESLGDAVLDLRVDQRGYARGIDSAHRSAKRLQAGFLQVGKVLVGVGAIVTGVGVAALKMSMDFNKSMANVATLIPGPTARVNELKTAVQELAVAHGKDTQDLAKGLYQTISAFGDEAGKTVEILRINSMAAAAGLAETTQAIDLTAAITKAYGDTSAAAVQKVADLALMTVRLGQTDFPQLASSMGRVTPIAQAMGQSQEDLFAVFATATGVVGTAAEVSTQYRGVLAALLNPTETMTDLIEKSGFASGKAMLEQRGLVGTLQDVVAAAEASGEPITKYVSNIEAVPLALALAGPQADTFAAKLAELGNAAGAVDVAFKEQTEGVNKLGFQWDVLRQQGVVLMQQIGDRLTPVVSNFIGIISGYVAQEGPQIVEMIGVLLVQALEGAVTAVGIMGQAFIKLKEATALTGASIAALNLGYLELQRNQLEKTIAAGAKAMEAWGFSMEDAQTRLADLNSRIASGEGVLDSFADSYLAAGTEGDKFSGIIAGMQDKIREWAAMIRSGGVPAAKELEDAIEGIGEPIPGVVVRLRGLAEAAGASDEAMKRFGITIPDFTADMGFLNEIVGDVQFTIVQQRDAVEKLWAEYAAGGHLTPGLIKQFKELAGVTGAKLTPSIDAVQKSFLDMFLEIKTGNQVIDGIQSKLKSFLGIFKSIA